MIYFLHFSNPNNTKISPGSPKWFNIFPEWKIKLFKEELSKKEETITVFSKNQNWLTVTPKNQDRRKALEKNKILKMDITSQLMPRWMEIKYIKEKNNNNNDQFKSMEYNYPLKQKPKKIMAFVDKDINPKNLKPINYNPYRSVFNLNDFRHNLITRKQANYYGAKVSQMPRKFFDWDDGKKFIPKFKKDI